MFTCVVAQFIGFALMWWTPQPYERMRGEYRQQVNARRASVRVEEMGERVPMSRSAEVASTAPGGDPDAFFPRTAQALTLNIRRQWEATYTMLVPLAQICALLAVSSHGIIVFITLLVVLVAQAPGVAQITRSLIWSVLLTFMFLPWQYFAREFPIPGVIYSYQELLGYIGHHVVAEPVVRTYGYEIWLVYGRFIVWPVIGLLALLITSERYRAGVMIAIGHPLQSILQPRGGGPIPPSPGPAIPKPRPLSVSPGNAGTKRH
jgi:hypothetical protein